MVAIPVGGYMMADGASNFVEGFSKMRNSLVAPGNPSYNPLRDEVFKRLFGEKRGEEYYKKASLVAGIYTIARDIDKLPDTVRNIPRAANIQKAEALNLPTEMVIVDNGKNLVITIQEINARTSTPMILQRILINKADLGKGLLFLGIDIRNTAESIK